jgi:hypothetical protein
MDSDKQKTDAEVIQENTDYVLGMYDLYQNDDEIVSALRMKGLPSHIIAQVLHRVKEPAYAKRVRQGKRLMVIGITVFAIMLLIELLLRNLPGSDTMMDSDGRDAAEGMLRGVFRFYGNFYHLAIIGFVLQAVVGFTVYKKYKRLLKQVQY